MAKNTLPAASFSNVILKNTANELSASFLEHLKPVAGDSKTTLLAPNQSIKDAYFVEQGMVSIISTMTDGKAIEVGTVGREGVVGGTVLLGMTKMPYLYMVQVPVQGYRVLASALLDECTRNSSLRQLILRYQASLLTSVMQNVACNGLHDATQRCCKWLLMSRDRSPSNVVPITHEFLGIMLGIRRASVSEVLHPLQQKGFLRCGRGAITIVSRETLEAKACECYRVIADQYEQMLS